MIYEVDPDSSTFWEGQASNHSRLNAVSIFFPVDQSEGLNRDSDADDYDDDNA